MELPPAAAGCGASTPYPAGNWIPIYHAYRPSGAGLRAYLRKKGRKIAQIYVIGRWPPQCALPACEQGGRTRIESIAVKPLHSWRLGKRRLAALLLALGAFVFLSGIQSWPDQLHGLRRVSQQDELYRYVAQELDEPALCEQIPWSTESPGGFFIAPSYERSNCYAFIAGRTKNSWLCWKVKRLGALRFLSQQTSMWSCLVDARRGLHAGIGVSPEELVAIGRQMTFLLPEDRPDEETLILERIGRGERVEHFETVRRAKNGDLIAVSLTISPIRDDRGRIIGASHVARNISERKRLDE